MTLEMMLVRLIEREGEGEGEREEMEVCMA